MVIFTSFRMLAFGVPAVCLFHVIPMFIFGVWPHQGCIPTGFVFVESLFLFSTLYALGYSLEYTTLSLSGVVTWRPLLWSSLFYVAVMLVLLWVHSSGPTLTFNSSQQPVASNPPASATNFFHFFGFARTYTLPNGTYLDLQKPVQVVYYFRVTFLVFATVFLSVILFVHIAL